MANINLMPWREKRRKQKQKAFLTTLGLAAAAAVGLILVLMTLQGAIISQHEARNQYLEKEIEEMDKKIALIQDLDIKRERLLGRKQVIEELQSSRSQMVHLFDELVRTVPEGMQLASVKQTNNFLVIEGYAESSSRVSDYLRRLEGSGWIKSPDLQIIEAKDRSKASKGVSISPSLPYDFKVQLTLANPNAKTEDGESGDGFDNADDSKDSKDAKGKPKPKVKPKKPADKKEA